ncbi:MAG: hypothetical protein K5697_16930 [Lachnospiraceae bacterium]|nr:hypothetical protein [Lachnospiraceae bacterium]
MANELIVAFIDQMIESLEGIGEALKILELHCQNQADETETKAENEPVSEAEQELERLRKLMGIKAKDGKGESIRELLSLFQAKRLSDIRQEDYSRLTEMVQKL